MEINQYTVLWQMLNFFILLLILRRFLFKPVLKVLDARRAQIAATLAAAEAEKQSATSLRAEYTAQMAVKQAEGEKILAAAKSAGEAARAEILAAAEAEAAALLATAGEQIARDKRQALADLVREVASYSVDMAEKMVRKTVDQSTHDQLIADVIAEIGETEWRV